MTESNINLNQRELLEYSINSFMAWCNDTIHRFQECSECKKRFEQFLEYHSPDSKKILYNYYPHKKGDYA